jgi:hypothetical protein
MIKKGKAMKSWKIKRTRNSRNKRKDCRGEWGYQLVVRVGEENDEAEGDEEMS